MSRSKEISIDWLEAQQLETFARGKAKQALGEKMNRLEEELFAEAEARIDLHYERKRAGSAKSGKGQA